jgi:hypothetical protein
MRAWLLLVLALAGGAAHADWQARSWSRWQFDGAVAAAVFGVERSELMRLGGSADAAWFAAELRATVALHEGGQACVLQDAVPLGAGDTVRVQLRWRCPAAIRSPRVRLGLLLGVDRNPLHHASFVHADGRHEEALFTRDAPELALAPAPRPLPGTATALRYLGLGFSHILAGLDHVAFLLCMLLVAARLSSRLWMITGFTVGHSITLSLSVLGLVSVRGAAVEALIGYTVALLAAEACLRLGLRSALWQLWLVVAGVGALTWARGGALTPLTLVALLLLTPAYLALAQRRRGGDALHLGMTAVFGLAHGLGFAGVLNAIGVPAGQRGWALAGFNVGVELGQVALLLVFALLLEAQQRLRSAALARGGRQVAAIVLCALGVYWLAGRSLA